MLATIAPTLPFGIPKTDQKRYQSIDVEEHYGKRVLVTLKIDGQSATYYWHNRMPHLPNGALFEGVVIVGENFSFKVINLHYDSKK